MYRYYIVYVHSCENGNEYRWMYGRTDQDHVNERAIADFYEQVGMPLFGSNIIISWQYMGLWEEIEEADVQREESPVW